MPASKEDIAAAILVDREVTDEDAAAFNAITIDEPEEIERAEIRRVLYERFPVPPGERHPPPRVHRLFVCLKAAQG